MLSEGFHTSKVYFGFCTPTSLSLLNGTFIFFLPFERVTMQATKRAHQSSGAGLTGRWAWALVPLPLSLKSCMISMDVKHHERRRCTFSISDVTPFNFFPHTRSLWHAASCYANEILWIVRTRRDCKAMCSTKR